MMKDFRHLRHTPREERVAGLAARHFKAVKASVRVAVGGWPTPYPAGAAAGSSSP